MHERKNLHRKTWNDRKIYPTYEPYPVSLDPETQSYHEEGDSGETRGGENIERAFEESPFTTDPISFEDPFPSQANLSDREHSLRPLELLNSLFSDRLDFLNRALEELENARNEREKLTHNGLEELDSGIKVCEHSLSLALLNAPDEKRHLERKLMELKQERRREKLLNWRDMVWLRGEIRKLRREIETLGRTAKSAENRGSPA